MTTIGLRSLLGSMPALLGYLRYRRVQKRFLKFSPEPYRAERVYCLGSGPSLDMFDLATIRDSTVLLLNGAIDVHPHLSAQNRFLWVCQDESALLSTYPRVPRQLPKLISVHRFEKASKVLQMLSFDDYFLVPKATFRPKYPTMGEPRTGRLYLRPKLAGYGGCPMVMRSIDEGFIYPASVMLFAISVAAMLAEREIHLVGFDMGVGPADNANGYSALVRDARTTGPDRYPQAVIEAYLSALKDHAASQGVEIYNHSPFSPERILNRVR
jgi:hypothetical protein